MENDEGFSYCIICGEELGENGKTVKNGLEAIRLASKKRNDGLAAALAGKAYARVHEACRRDYTERKRVERAALEAAAREEKRQLRSAEHLFSYKTNCLLCGKDVPAAEQRRKHPGRNPVSEVTTFEVQGSLRSAAERRGDAWGHDVRARIENAIDLVAAEALYHRQCYKNFVHSRALPTPTQSPMAPSPAASPGPSPAPSPAASSTSARRGRKPDTGRQEALTALFAYMESAEDCQFSLAELAGKMRALRPLTEPYTGQYLLEKVKAHFGDRIVVASLPGIPNVLCLKGAASKLLQKAWYEERHLNAAEERLRIVAAAAQIVREDIRGVPMDTTRYPTAKEVESGGEELVPDTLKLFLNEVVCHNKKSEPEKLKRKCTTIAQDVMAATRPRSFLSPWHLGLAIFIHRRYGAKLLLNILSAAGSCASYYEATKFEDSSVRSGAATVVSGAYRQWIFDNFDFNSRTMTGHDTIHWMGGVTTVTPRDAVVTPEIIPRNLILPSSGNFRKYARIPFQFPPQNSASGLSSLQVQMVEDFGEAVESAATAVLLDILWLFASWCGELPGWSGFMSAAYKTCGPLETSAVLPTPFINMKPTDPATIYTALRYASDECRQNDQSHAMVTFDHPLYWKALNMILSESVASGPLSNVVLRLGGFHQLMSFMGAVGNIMEGSGLEELWQCVYAKNTVPKMMSGHSYARALRAHFLAQTALVHLIFDEADRELDDATREQAVQLADQLQTNTITPEVAAQHPTVSAVRDQLEATMERLSHSRTARLWINYFKMVQIMRLFFRAERCGDWFLSLQATKQMIPYFIAAGHFNYFKACNTYLQQMRSAQRAMPTAVFQSFSSGRFTIRTHEKFWGGVWTDMIIEQNLMRFLKGDEGITRGRGTSDRVIARLLQALPVTTKFIAAVEAFTGTRMQGSEQHVELRPERQRRDRNDLEKFSCWLSQRSPFADRPSDRLVSIATGIIGDASTNCDSAYDVGMAEWQKHTGTPFSSLTLRRNSRVRTFSSVGITSKTGADPALPVDSDKLFHRILCRMNQQGSAGVLLPECLSYELDNFPPSLFDKSLMRQPSKAGFVAIINGYLKGEKCTLPPSPFYTVDGGFLLHRVPWPDFATFGTVCGVYLSYVRNKYGPLCHVVFDGYETNGIKDHAHMRREGKTISADMQVSADIPVGCAREAFLGNSKNKTQLISMLSSQLRQAGVEVTQDPGDADRRIVLTAIDKAEGGHQSVLVGEDMDLIVLLAVLLPPQKNVIILKPGRSNAEDQLFSGHAIQIKMGEWVDHLLTMYAFTGCDSTSAPHQRGKVKSWKKFISAGPDFLRELREFQHPNLGHEKVASLGEKLMLFLYGAPTTSDLNKIREDTYKTNVSKQNPGQVFEMKTLPPTSHACRQHSFRAYIQVQEWQGRRLKPDLWGWIWDGCMYRPNPSDKPPAPSSILNQVLCNCAVECEEHCECRRSRLHCTEMCGNCAGIGCSNAPALEVTEDSDEDPDDVEG